jgi:hypothetical protein
VAAPTFSRLHPSATIAALAMALGACGGASLPVGAPVVCEVERSDNACFRCQAQRCGAQLDRCHGEGFHEGRSVGPVQSRCGWNPDTQRYDRNCSYGGGAWSSGGGAPAGYRDGRVVDASPGPVAPAAPCGAYAACFQSCGCGVACSASCTGSTGDAAVAATTYYSNDPRLTESGCSSCLNSILAPCVKQLCAEECRDVTDGGP